MGYTRYFRRTDKPITQAFVDGVKEIIRDCTEKGITIRDWDGQDEPEITLDVVSFNGNADTGLEHESFVIDNNPDEVGEFNFCKTARKPYDYAVKKALELAGQEGLVCAVSDDGDNPEGYSDEDYLNNKVDWY